MSAKNQAFSLSSLKRCIYPDDFYNDKKLSCDQYREQIVKRSLSIAENNFEDGINYEKFFLSEKDKKKNKPTFYSNSLEEKLILRRCSSNIRSTIKNKQKNRSVICREIKGFLKEGTPYRIYKTDIKSFFENADNETVKKALNKNTNISIHTKDLVESYLEKIGGFIPRGMEFSSTLAELILEEFDDKVLRNERVIYFSRYVDDILIITDSIESEKKFFKEIKSYLPKGLSFNYNKTEITSLKKRGKSGENQNGKIVGKFDYLGYEFNIIDTQLDSTKNKNIANSVFRKVVVKISKSKIVAIKTKISKSLKYYAKNGNFEELKSRIKFLTSNRDLVQKPTGHKIPTGIYYNYNLIDVKCNSLSELDSALSNFVMNYENLFTNESSFILSKNQKRELLKCSFISGFTNRIYKKYSPKKLKEIVRIWK